MRARQEDEASLEERLMRKRRRKNAPHRNRTTDLLHCWSYCALKMKCVSSCSPPVFVTVAQTCFRQQAEVVFIHRVFFLFFVFSRTEFQNRLPNVMLQCQDTFLLFNR